MSTPRAFASVQIPIILRKVSYKAKIDSARRKTLDDLANEAQELDMGY
jgi:hypothetical protein